MGAAQTGSRPRTQAFALGRSTLGWLAAYWLSLPASVFLSFFLIGIALPVVATAWWLSQCILAVRRRAPGRCWLIAAAPFLVLPLANSLSAVVGYWTGTAELQSSILDERLITPASYTNLDPELRCARNPASQFITIYPFCGGPYNLSLRGLVRAFGPVHGTYHGPYPTQPEALWILAQCGVTVSRADLEAGRITLADGQPLLLPELFLQLQLNHGRNDGFKSNGYSGGAVQVAKLDNCLVVRYDANYSETIALVDAATQRVFARYDKYDH